MRAYIIRRLLLMIPTLFGLTVLTFFIMQLAPGDPLALQLSQSGAQGESSTTRQAFLLQRRQWKLDRPLFLNFRWFTDYSSDARLCAYFQGRTDEEILAELERLADSRNLDDDAAERLDFLRGLGVERFEERLSSGETRKGLLQPVKIGVQIHVETLSQNSVPVYAELLRTTDDRRLKIGGIRGLVMALLGDPFTYTYSRDPEPSETEAVVSTWSIWWDRSGGTFPPVTPERRSEIEKTYLALLDEPSRAKILAAMKSFEKSDAPYFMEVLRGDSSLKGKMVASLALRSHIGKPLRVDVKLTDPAPEVDRVAGHWIAFYDTNQSRYNPGFFSKAWRLLTDTQYANSLVKLITFDFGKSMVGSHDPVGPKILSTALVSAPIMLISQALVYLLAIPGGVLCAITRGRWTDRLISLGLFILYSIPAFVAAMIFLTVFSYGKPWSIFPTQGIHSHGYEEFSAFRLVMDYFWHIFLPVVSLSIFSLAGLAMYSRSAMLDVVNQDYIRTARAKGLSGGKVIFKHALRNALIPIITLFANFLPVLLGGSVLIEVIFNIPGMGRLSYEAILEKDYNTLMAIIYIDGIIVMFSFLLSDLLYVVVDPRISFSRSEAGS